MDCFCRALCASVVASCSSLQWYYQAPPNTPNPLNAEGTRTLCCALLLHNLLASLKILDRSILICDVMICVCVQIRCAKTLGCSALSNISARSSAAFPLRALGKNHQPQTNSNQSLNFISLDFHFASSTLFSNLFDSRPFWATVYLLVGLPHRSCLGQVGWTGLCLV